MPHVVRRGCADLHAAWRGLPLGPWRWGRAVARVEGRYLAAEGHTLLVQCVVVEYGRPLHPVIMIAHRGQETAVHLWPVVRVERTEAVKRVVLEVAAGLQAFGAGEIVATNLTELS
jgi:hypothetical protein